jgi:hypothetical protein
MFPAARIKKVRGAGRAGMAQPRAPAFPGGGVESEAGQGGKFRIEMKGANP